MNRVIISVSICRMGLLFGWCLTLSFGFLVKICDQCLIGSSVVLPFANSSLFFFGFPHLGCPFSGDSEQNITSFPSFIGFICCDIIV